MKNSAKFIATCMLVAGAAFSTAFNTVSAAEDCKAMDPKVVIADLVMEHEGSKVLKVEESVDDMGCVELKVRILIDGTVKAITIPNTTGA